MVVKEIRNGDTIDPEEFVLEFITVEVEFTGYSGGIYEVEFDLTNLDTKDMYRFTDRK